VGVQEYGNISASYSKGAVENINSGNDAYAGGITGWLRYGGQSIEDCYSLGDITAKYSADGGLWVMAAGILGTTSGNTANIKIRHCYAAGTVQVINSGTGPIISGGIAGQLYSSQISGTSNLDNNVYLGPSVIGRGSGGKHIHFLYALREDPPTNTNTYRGWRLSTATKQYSASATGGLTGDISIVDLDGTSRTGTQINTAWSGWGYTTTTWSTSNFNTIGTGSNERKAPKLYWE
jgi:hypothetical protein